MKMLQLFLKCDELFGISGAGGAIQVKKSPDVNVAWLARVEAVKGLYFYARKEMRHHVIRRNDCNWIPLFDILNAGQQQVITL
ncbi:MAG: hypothetical protein WA987_11010 [Cellvibrio sp.]